MYLVGLTGGIASGKSLVVQRLVEHGAEVVDADLIAREIVAPGTETWRRIREHFGDEIIGPDGAIDRQALGRIVFADEDKRRLLNELTHPRVIAEIADRLEMLTAFDGVVVVAVPLLVEAGIDRGYEDVVVVASRPETQIRRLVDLRGLSPEAAEARVRAQAPLEEKLAVATHVLWNEGTIEQLLAETDQLAKELLARAHEKAQRLNGDIPNN
jgi:dephospho-CoA kinase